jgi:oligopeptide transport system substrate-binding protein
VARTRLFRLIDRQSAARLILVFVASIQLAACSGGNSAAASGILVRGLATDPDSLDPQRAASTEAQTVLRDVCEGLTVLNRRGEAIPGSAESFEVSSDRLTYTFHLRPKIRWSNGDQVVGEDFVAALRRLADPSTASQYAEFISNIKNATDILAGRKPAAALGASAPDESTVIIGLNSPYPFFLQLLAHPCTCPVHRRTLAQYPDRFGRPGTMVTNGAFVPTEWTIHTQIVLRPNPNYWDRQSVRLAGVKYLVTPDANDELTRYRAGILQITSGVSRSQFDWVRSALGPELHLTPQLGTYYYGFNLTKAPFKDNPDLRRALSLAIDREKLTKLVLRAGELPAYEWVPPGVMNYRAQSDSGFATPSVRLAEARRLYGEAGYSAQHPLHFELKFNNGEAHTKLAIAIAAMWKETLGVDTTLTAVEFKSLLQDIRSGDVEVFRSSWVADVNDPFNFLQSFLADAAGINLTHYRNPAFDDSMAQAQLARDDVSRRNSLEQAERTLLADQPVIPIYFYVNKHLVKPEVIGWYDNVLGVVYSKDLQLKRLP